MENQLQLFNFDNQKVRALSIDNKPYFVGKDVAEILDYKLPTKAVTDHVDPEDKRSEIVKASQIFQNGKGYISVDLINESGVYSLIFSSNMPKAKSFKHWVTYEVLPAIRKHGAYMTDQKAFNVVHNKDGLADLLQQAANQLKEKDVQIEQMKPKALFADSVSASKTTVLVGELAKILRGNGVDIGTNRLFKWLRKHGYLIKRRGTDYNMPTQRSMDLGLFKVHERVITSVNNTRIVRTPKVTGKGQQYFINKFLQG